MPGSTIGLDLPYGMAGTVSYSGPDSPVIEAKTVKSTSASIPFGAVVIQNTDNTVNLSDANTTAANFAGIAAVEVKQQIVYPTVGTNVAGQYAPLQKCDVIKKGIVSVACKRGTPTAGGAVYVRTVLNGSFPAALIGDLEASSDSTNSVLLTNCCWHSNRIDSNQIAQLKIKTINN